jgi:glycosyltransferase involved in cell wall biosynthesis
LVGVEEQEKLWLLSIGSEFERREWGSFSEVVLPRISPSQLKQVIKIADLCLFPSLIFDVAPLLVTEFKEMRKPIIASDVGGVRECLGASSAKYIRNPNSVLEWRHTIINSLGIGQEREDCSSASDASEGTVPVEEWVEIWLELFAEISDIHHQNENGR